MTQERFRGDVRPAPPPRHHTAAAEATADRIHSAAIHLLRWLRKEDAAIGLSAPRLSALSVVVFGGPLTLGELAATEQVRPPTMTRLVDALESEGLVVRELDPHDGRVTRLRATRKGRDVLAAGRARRIAALTRRVDELSARDRETLHRAASVLEALVARSPG